MPGSAHPIRPSEQQPLPAPVEAPDGTTVSSPRRPGRWIAGIVAGVVFANGALAMVTVLVTRISDQPSRLSALLPLGLVGLNRSLTLGLGLLLVYLSLQLAGRRRAAWWSTIAIVLLSTLLHGARREWPAALVAAATVPLLLLTRARFTVPTDPRRALRGTAIGVAMALGAVVYGTIGFWLLETRDVGRTVQLGEAMVRAVRELSFVGNPDLHPRTPHAAWFLDSLRMLAVLTAALVAWSVFRPLAYRLRTLPQERAEVEAIIARHGRAPLDYFKTWPDKSYHFSPTRAGVVAYRAAWSVAISLGDPVGPADELDALIGSFARFCADHGWRAAFHQVLPDLRAAYRHHGFEVLKIGEEALVDLERFAASTVAQRPFHKPRRRLAAAGFRVLRHRPPHPDSVLEEIEAVSAEWLSLPGRRERAFVLGRCDRGYLQRTPVALVRDAGGRLIAFVNEVPGIRPGLATVDMMRHRRDAPNGVMEYLFGELLLALRGEGYRWFSLGLAPLAGVGDRPGASLQERAAHQVYEHLTAVFSFKGLRSYKAKFEPVWEDRFLVYQDGAHGLIRTALALGRVTRG